MKIDTSKFKKVDCDENCTTLAHPGGHEIRIAHKGLSPELKKTLDEIPVSFAKGGRAKFAQKYDPNANPKGARPSQVAKSSNKMPGSPTMAKDNYTEPDAMGTNIPKGMLQEELHDKHYPDVVLQALNKKAPPFGPLSAEPKQHYPPCINPSCKSYGKSHPNCRCYGGNGGSVLEAGNFAEGGKVGNYCSQERAHQQGCQYFVDGGDVKPEASPTPAPDFMNVQSTPVPSQKVDLDQEIKNAEDAANQADPMPQDQDSEEPQPDQEASANPEVMQSRTPASSGAPQEPDEPDAYAKVQNDTKFAHDLMSNETDHFIADVNAGHITPKTYHDLYADKSLPGKIGTIFGLMLSGAGSGLAHQDNALLGMMKKEIDRDLEEQKASATNKQNFLSINAQNLAHMAQTGKIGAETQILSNTMAKDQMNYGFYNDLADYAKKLPPGPLQQQAYQKLAFLGQAMTQDHASAKAQAAHGYALSRLMGGGGNNTMLMKSGLAGPEMTEAGQDIEQKTFNDIPSVKGQLTSRPIPQQAQDQALAMDTLDQKGKDVLNYIQKNAGTLAKQLKSSADFPEKGIARQKVEEMKNFYNDSIKGGALTQGRLSWYDEQFPKNPLSVLSNMVGNTDKLREMVNSNLTRRDLLLKSYGLHPKGSNSGQPNMSPHEGKTATGPNGSKMIIKNGKWVPFNG